MAQSNAGSAVLNTVHTNSAARWSAAVVAGSVLVAICAHISVPLFFTPVPMTLQPFAVLLLGLFMEPTAAFATLVLYLLQGAAGLPVFTPQGPGGIAQLMGPTGGYLMSYPFVAALVSFIFRSLPVRNFFTAIVAAAAGNALILTAGTGWLATVTHQSMSHTASLAVVPFLVGDALKICLAAAIVTGWLRARKIEETVVR
ncbi:MAG TPA: biotin transporter BioY [Pseudacidobacterium sp.]|jgi:biotin transport system substrate-specific component|nr:biotin transporter BioY [Pseudacidobacterium sp.]